MMQIQCSSWYQLLSLPNSVGKAKFGDIWLVLRGNRSLVDSRTSFPSLSISF